MDWNFLALNLAIVLTPALLFLLAMLKLLPKDKRKWTR